MSNHVKLLEKIWLSDFWIRDLRKVFNHQHSLGRTNRPILVLTGAHLVFINLEWLMDGKRRLRVLVVDEETEYFEQLVECAELCRHDLDVEYQYASSREQAKALIRSWAPSAVVVDLHLGGDSGFDLIRGCTESAIPVVATSPLRSSTLERDALRQGALAYFAQSEDLEELEAVLKTISQVAVREFSLH